VDFGAASDKGLVREVNEDNFIYFEGVMGSSTSIPNINPKYAVAIVADGMGGCQAGEIASSYAVETVAKFIKNNQGKLNEENVFSLLKEAIEEANSFICSLASQHSEYDGMGTTITVAVTINSCLYIAHVGDSRAYLIREYDIIQLTEDHSLVNELIKNGNITAEEAANHPQKNIITRAVGADFNVNIDFITQPIKGGDILVVCSDGLSNLIAADEIKEIVSKHSTLQIAAQTLVDTAIRRGGYDNITVVLQKIVDTDLHYSIDNTNLEEEVCEC
jgi:protein phosphatase